MDQFLKMIATVTGGIGIILLGMVLMTDSLKSLSGNTMKKVLYRLTSNSFISVLSGAGFTSLIHNSSAVILATVGFVGAGLLSFTSAIGVILGANLGTTSTAWIVAIVGFKFHIGIITLPFVAVGALMKLFSKGKRATIGMAVAGFCLLFVGIDVLQDGMRFLSQYINLSGFSISSIPDELILVAVGIAMTVALQSSTVAVVTTITALNAGTITLEQSALLLIGQNIGKFYYGILASIGASNTARQTALVHILFNVATGVVVFVIHDYFTLAVVSICRYFGAVNPSIVISAYHTAFNLFGIVLMLPFGKYIATLVKIIIKPKVSVLTKRLDFRIANVPSVAVEAARFTIAEIAALILLAMRELVIAEVPYPKILEKIDEADEALVHTSEFLANVRSEPDASFVYNQHIDVLHATEHLKRLAEACREAETVRTTAHTPYLRQLALDHLAEIDATIIWLQEKRGKAPTESVEQISSQFAEVRKQMRNDILDKTAHSEIQPDVAFGLLEAMRWLDRLAYHVWRAIYHLSSTGT